MLSGVRPSWAVHTYYPSLHDAESKPTQHPTCTSTPYKSKFLPSWQLVAVHMQTHLMQCDLMQIGNIHPYWRLRNHPLYPQACAHCNVEPQPSDFGPSHSSQAPPSATPAQPAEQPEVVEVAGLRLAIDDVQAVRVPSTEALRIRTLSNAFHLLQSKVNTAWKFKLAMATVAALQEALEAPSGGTPAAETSPRGSTQGAQGR